MTVITQTEQAKKGVAARERATKIGTRDLKLAAGELSLEKIDSPTSEVLNEAANTPKTASQNRQERRRQRRAGVKVLVRLRPADGKDEKFEEILGTRNASRANLYVVSASRYYYKQMPLRVTFPFDSALDSASASEETAEIVRLDHLPDGRVGVAIRFQQPIATTSKKSDAPGKPNGERRLAIRHTISAAAKLTDWESNTRLLARCSDLSVAGCYIDTMNPFPENSIVRLQLTNNQETFEVDAHVISRHVGMGMGLVFDGLGPEQMSVLADWLSKRAPTPVLGVEPSSTTGELAAPEAAGLSDRELIAKLLRLLETKLETDANRTLGAPL
jgi:hypothetical protein